MSFKNRSVNAVFVGFFSPGAFYALGPILNHELLLLLLLRNVRTVYMYMCVHRCTVAAGFSVLLVSIITHARASTCVNFLMDKHDLHPTGDPEFVDPAPPGHTHRRCLEPTSNWFRTRQGDGVEGGASDTRRCVTRTHTQTRTHTNTLENHSVVRTPRARALTITHL